MKVLLTDFVSQCSVPKQTPSCLAAKKKVIKTKETPFKRTDEENNKVEKRRKRGKKRTNSHHRTPPRPFHKKRQPTAPLSPAQASITSKSETSHHAINAAQ
jgi:hypothetical protein